MSPDITRREFLKTTGIALAGAAVAPTIITSASADPTEPKNKSAKKLRIGVVGGGFGCSFQWHLDPNCVVQAVSDLRPERRESLKNVYKCGNAYNSLEELIKNKDVDAVAVFTGAPDHVRHAVACMKAGKHVISAVPAATNMRDAELLLETVKKTGLTYMMAETSYYGQNAIAARKFYNEGKFGNVFYVEAEYHHPGLEVLFTENGVKTWRYGFPPMHYPTHCTAFLTGVTGERIVEASCIGWGNDSQYLKDNDYNNPFWNETAFFKTDKGNGCRVAVWWYGPHGGCERAQWYGDKMSFFMSSENGMPPLIRRMSGQQEKDQAGFVRDAAEFEKYDIPEFWKTDLPEPMRMCVGHDGAEPFLTHEFVDALVNDRRPAVDIYQALSYSVPGIIAHESALHGGKQMTVPVYRG
jgi:predicted dehydrogenase